MSCLIPLSSLHDRATQWFDRAHAALLGELPCRRGCCRCCIGPFAVTVLDVVELRRGWPSLEPSVRQDIEARARTQIAMFQRSFPRLTDSQFLDDWSDEEIDALATHFGDLPCPALGGDGSCRIYPFRPVACRTMGIPVELDGRVEGACEVQTAVPVVRLPHALREKEERLAEREASEIQALRAANPKIGEELWLAYGFLPDVLALGGQDC